MDLKWPPLSAPGSIREERHVYHVEVDKESAQNNDLKEIAADTFKGWALVLSKGLCESLWFPTNPAVKRA
jgi:hypothetical protein